MELLQKIKEVLSLSESEYEILQIRFHLCNALKKDFLSDLKTIILDLEILLEDIQEVVRVK